MNIDPAELDQAIGIPTRPTFEEVAAFAREHGPGAIAVMLTRFAEANRISIGLTFDEGERDELARPAREIDLALEAAASMLGVLAGYLEEDE